jgi:hypothetical protein
MDMDADVVAVVFLDALAARAKECPSSLCREEARKVTLSSSARRDRVRSPALQSRRSPLTLTLSPLRGARANSCRCSWQLLQSGRRGSEMTGARRQPPVRSKGVQGEMTGARRQPPVRSKGVRVR